LLKNFAIKIEGRIEYFCIIPALYVLLKDLFNDTPSRQILSGEILPLNEQNFELGQEIKGTGT
jgi:hypothetical protein